MPKLTDLPPVWLVLSLGLVWGLDRLVPWGLFGPQGGVIGGALIGLGLLLMAVAAAQMLARRTTVIPKNDPAALVTDGIFRLSRNPIYLGDALVLFGLILRLDAPLALPLLPVFVWVIERRFILPEEKRLRTKFRQEFFRYTEKTRRWI